MQEKELREYAEGKGFPDRWWLALDGAPEEGEFTLAEALERKRAEGGRDVHVVNLSEEGEPDWFSLDLAPPPGGTHFQVASKDSRRKIMRLKPGGGAEELSPEEIQRIDEDPTERLTPSEAVKLKPKHPLIDKLAEAAHLKPQADPAATDPGAGGAPAAAAGGTGVGRAKLPRRREDELRAFAARCGYDDHWWVFVEGEVQEEAIELAAALVLKKVNPKQQIGVSNKSDDRGEPQWFELRLPPALPDDIRSYAAGKDYPDSWWVSVDGDVQPEPIEISAAAVVKKLNPERKVRVANKADPGAEPEWFDLKLPPAGQSRAPIPAGPKAPPPAPPVDVSGGVPPASPVKPPPTAATAAPAAAAASSPAGTRPSAPARPAASGPASSPAASAAAAHPAAEPGPGKKKKFALFAVVGTAAAVAIGMGLEALRKEPVSPVLAAVMGAPEVALHVDVNALAQGGFERHAAGWVRALPFLAVVPFEPDTVMAELGLGPGSLSEVAFSATNTDAFFGGKLNDLRFVAGLRCKKPLPGMAVEDALERAYADLVGTPSTEAAGADTLVLLPVESVPEDIPEEFRASIPVPPAMAFGLLGSPGDTLFFGTVAEVRAALARGAAGVSVPALAEDVSARFGSGGAGWMTWDLPGEMRSGLAKDLAAADGLLGLILGQGSTALASTESLRARFEVADGLRFQAVINCSEAGGASAVRELLGETLAVGLKVAAARVTGGTLSLAEGLAAAREGSTVNFSGRLAAGDLADLSQVFAGLDWSAKPSPTAPAVASAEAGPGDPPAVAVELEEVGAGGEGEGPGGADGFPTLIAKGAVWRFWDRDRAPDKEWFAAAFDDSTWARGRGVLGYGDESVRTFIDKGTKETYGNKNMTAYFRHRFNVADPSAVKTLVLHLKRDDGAVVYLNGAEVVRSNMPGGEVRFHTPAADVVGAGAEAGYHPYEMAPGKLVPGENVIAVEVHQQKASSSDLFFDLALLANGAAAPEAPETAGAEPPASPGIITLEEVEIPEEGKGGGDEVD